MVTRLLKNEGRRKRYHQCPINRWDKLGISRAVRVRMTASLIFFILILLQFSQIRKGVNLENSHTGAVVVTERKTEYILSTDSGKVFSSKFLVRKNDAWGRNLHFIASNSGCYIAAWVYMYWDCKRDRRGPWNKVEDFIYPTNQGIVGHESEVEYGDTVYIDYKLLDQFVEFSLPKIVNTSIVVILGSTPALGNLCKTDGNCTKLFPSIEKLLDSNVVAKAFGQNVRIHFGERFVSHPKVHSFPYGTQVGSEKSLREAFARNRMLPNKTIGIFHGYLSSTNRDRRGVSKGGKLPHGLYMQRLANSNFVLSPNGDRPDCIRHIEAIAMGCIPITGMKQKYYSHYDGAPVVYENTNFSLTEHNAFQLLLSQLHYTDLEKKITHTTRQEKGANDTRSIVTTITLPPVNREMALEGYWMEWVEQKSSMDVRLRWWDRVNQKRAFLDELF